MSPDISLHIYFNSIVDFQFVGGVLTSSLVDHGFETLLGQSKDYKIGMCCFFIWF